MLHDFDDYEQSVIRFMAAEQHRDDSALTDQQSYELLVEFGDSEESQMHFRARG